MSDNPIFSYTRRDYEGARKAGLSKIPVISQGKWTDLNVTDPGVIILDYVHALVDMIQYYQDHQAMEAFITTAKERANIFRLAKQMSYKIRSAKGAACEVTFTTHRDTRENTVKIPKYTSVSTKSGISYLTEEDAYLVPEENAIRVACVQGKLVNVVYQGTGISNKSAEEGATNQSIRLVDSNIDIDSIQITDSIGVVWKPVDYIIFSAENEKVYQVDLNPDNTVTILFGNGERGATPKDTDSLTISYISTLAEEGRVGENEIILLNSHIYDSTGVYIDFTVNNNNASSGGSSVQSSREIKELAPGIIKSQDRAVTLSDFENLSKSVLGVADARAYDINNYPYDDILHHEVRVYIIPSDSSYPLDMLKNNVYEFLHKRMIPPTSLEVLSPTDKYVDLEITVRLVDEVYEGRVRYSIEEIVKEYFEKKAFTIGDTFYSSDLIPLIRDVNGVFSVVSISPSDIVEAGALSVLKLGKLTINTQGRR